MRNRTSAASVSSSLRLPYALVTHAGRPVCEVALCDDDGELTSVVQEILGKVGHSGVDSRQSFTHGQKFVRLAVVGQFVAAAVVSAAVPIGVAFSFLEAVLEEFNEQFPGWGSSVAARMSSTLASEQFSPHLKRLMREVEINEKASSSSGGGTTTSSSCSSSSSTTTTTTTAATGSTTDTSSSRNSFSFGPDLVRNVEDELRAVKASVVTNIDKAVMRGEAVDAMAQRTESLRHEGQRFRRAGKAIYAKMWWQDYKIAAYTVAGVGAIVYLTLACVCGPTFRSCAIY